MEKKREKDGKKVEGNELEAEKGQRTLVMVVGVGMGMGTAIMLVEMQYS